MAVSILDKTDFRGENYQKQRTVVSRANSPKKKSNLNVFVLKQSCKLCGAKPMELKEEIDKSTIIAGDCNTLAQQLIEQLRQENKQDYRIMT